MNQKDFEAFVDRLDDKHDIIGRNRLGNFAVLVALIKLEGDYHFLFQKRAKNIRQGSEISFPGGQFDEGIDKNFKDTAVRETCEELGISSDQIKVIKQIDSFVGHVYIENFLGLIEVDSLDDLNINMDEVAYVFTMPVQYFIDNEPETYGIKVRSYSSEVDEAGNLIEYFPVKELDLPERYHHTWNDSLREVYVYRTKHGTLWGLTAAIVYETIQKYF
ncbi:CoA pyrophosphatase [Acidaminobacter sp. JC074]|uniref:NUDIX hydrolase n=1 Tax=Acidaminobacter sp. JC074 TaxID=2530199 RepID=UPI001F0DC9D0|nr:CoA pyrophosphatase [Acidaminobacter sp. JC074]MCH4888510.1 CoA pyrophosphatase [Acidaminobacter sp. JC074]